jgi:hypothetical protein
MLTSECHAIECCVLLLVCLIKNIFDFIFSTNTFGSHKNCPFKEESHKGSAETMDGEEKKDASKEDLDEEGGKCILYARC